MDWCKQKRNTGTFPKRGEISVTELNIIHKQKQKQIEITMIHSLRLLYGNQLPVTAVSVQCNGQILKQFTCRPVIMYCDWTVFDFVNKQEPKTVEPI